MAINGAHLDNVVTAYVEWHKHSKFVRLAYDAWSGAGPDEEARRYAAYLEELDREQRACELYATAISRAAA